HGGARGYGSADGHRRADGDLVDVGGADGEVKPPLPGPGQLDAGDGPLAAGVPLRLVVAQRADVLGGEGEGDADLLRVGGQVDGEGVGPGGAGGVEGEVGGALAALAAGVVGHGAGERLAGRRGVAVVATGRGRGVGGGGLGAG